MRTPSSRINIRVIRRFYDLPERQFRLAVQVEDITPESTKTQRADPPKSIVDPRREPPKLTHTHTRRESLSCCCCTGKKEKGPTQRRRRRRCAASRNARRKLPRGEAVTVSQCGHGDAAVRLVVQLRARLPPGGRSHAAEGARRVNR
jgi:hypothetical protein